MGLLHALPDAGGKPRFELLPQRHVRPRTTRNRPTAARLELRPGRARGVAVDTRCRWSATAWWGTLDTTHLCRVHTSPIRQTRTRHTRPHSAATTRGVARRGSARLRQGDRHLRAVSRSRYIQRCRTGAPGSTSTASQFVQARRAALPKRHLASTSAGAWLLVACDDWRAATCMVSKLSHVHSKHKTKYRIRNSVRYEKDLVTVVT